MAKRLDVLTVGGLAFDSTCLSAAWHSRKQKVPVAILCNTSPRTRAGGVSVEEVAHEAPCPSRVLGWLLGRESGAAAIQRRRTPRRSCACPQGPRHEAQGPRAVLPQIPTSPIPISRAVHQPSARAFLLPGSAPATGPGSRVSLVRTPPSIKSRWFDARCHVRSRLQVTPWRPVSQSVG